MWQQIITAKNVQSRLAVAAIMILAGFYLIEHALHSNNSLFLGFLLLIVGTAMAVSSLRWFWRLFIVAWFR